MKSSEPTFELNKEKVIIMAMATDNKHLENEVLPSLAELTALIETSGGTVVAKVTQLRPARSAAHYLGQGKISEITELGQNLAADLLVCDEELTGSQIRKLEQLTGLRVLDRTLVILDIFARRAQSKEGKIQVELAQQQYRLSRLSHEEEDLSRLGGGIGTRGPGETKLETDRRHIHRRITQLKSELNEVSEHRTRLRNSRKRSGNYSVAVVGYTNAGKTTLVNKLCKADLEAKDQLFATLDPAARKMSVSMADVYAVTNDYSRYFAPLLVDTVGFIRRLPHTLVNAFHSTLQEATEADLILHIINAADSDAIQQFEVADKLLKDLGADTLPTIIALNKIDLVEDKQELDNLLDTVHSRLGHDERNICLQISAREDIGLQELQQQILQICVKLDKTY